ncbi:hypothetical protein BaRGS_00018569 [Batillaria attramentaria]|uniref:Uncharacterized protein n=1 Tax=Batillaria attramentaria TaxID=370345 RepID=A0ABD0KTJ0_9CAEN
MLVTLHTLSLARVLSHPAFPRSSQSSLNPNQPIKTFISLPVPCPPAGLAFLPPPQHTPTPRFKHQEYVAHHVLCFRVRDPGPQCGRDGQSVNPDQCVVWLSEHEGRAKSKQTAATT